MADAILTTETSSTDASPASPITPAAGSLADLAAKGDVRGFNAAREAHLRGERPSEPAKETPAEEPAKQPETPAAPVEGEQQTGDDAAEAAKASEAARTLAERKKSRRERREESIQSEINNLTKQRELLRQEVLAEQARVAAARAAAKPETAPPPPADDPEPHPDNFDTYEKYVRAAGRWEARQESRRLQAEVDKKLEDDRKSREAASLERGRQDVIAQHDARMAAARAAHADYDQVIAQNADLEVPPAFYQAIPFSPVGAEVMYHFAKHPDVADALLDLPISAPMRDAIMDSTATLAPKLLSFLASNPDECRRVASLSPRAALKEMGKLEARLDVAPSGPTPAAKPVTSAPPPIKPVGSSATATTLTTRELAQQGRGREFMDRRDREERERKMRRA